MSDERKRFGPIIVDYSTAQIKVIRKFESYHHELVNSFGKRLFELISQILKELRHQIEMLEGQEDWSKILSSSMEESTYDADEMSMLSKVNKFVLQLREAKKKKEEWSHTIPDLESSEKILQKHYYTFPSNWLWVAGVINEYEKFSQILKHFTSLFGANFNFFKDFVLKQAVACEEHLTELYAEWAEERPLQGGITSQTAFSIISRFDSRIKLLREEYDKVLEVKESLDCDTQSSSTMASIYKNSFLSDGCFKLTPDVIETEINNLRGVWTEFSKLHKELDTLKEMQWTATSPTKIRNSINLLNDTLKKVPAKYRQYEIFEHLKQTLQEYSNVNKIITSLSTDALKDRHWKMLVNLLGLHSTALNKISVGDLLNAGLEQHKNKIDEILAQAQGELALEEFISTLRQTWMSYEFNLYLYKNRCKLIREWDQLFSLLDDHLSSLQSMKSSPYYAVFQDEASSWDDRLSRVRQLVESWIEVQRKWVYLEGVFTESQDIQSLLPKEYSRFCSIDNDFLSIMKKTAQRPKLIELISSEGLQRSLDRLSELLSKIQKALGDYLERQRTVFPRFYFVGDEDLLEMIGNSKNIKLVQRHCVKIFAGISSFVTEVNNPHIITAMV
jgi:dynein heavy chain 1, cytosolic